MNSSALKAEHDSEFCIKNAALGIPDWCKLANDDPLRLS